MESRYRTLYYVCLALALLFLAFLGYKNWSLPLDTSDFTPESYYRSGTDYAQKIDPKTYYRQLAGLAESSNPEKDCNPTVVTAKNKTKLYNGQMFYYIDKDMGETKVTAEYIGKEGSGTFADNDVIVMPIEGTNFINSNMKKSWDDKSTTIDICAYVGDRTVIVFKDVKCWWCHNHITDLATQKHTIAIGNHSDSVVKSVRAGTIIGLAGPKTTVQMWRVTDDTYKPTEGKINKSEGVKFEQIDTGTYLVSGQVSVSK